MSLRDIDSFLFSLINNNLQNGIFDASMPVITDRYYLVILLLMVWLVIKDKKKALVPILLVVVSVALSDWIANLLKHLIERQRPCHSLGTARLLVGCGDSFSMPSNHAANSAAIIFALSCGMRRWLKWPLLAIALTVGFSRVYVGVHYPADVAAGMVLGVIVSLLVVSLYQKGSLRFDSKPYSTLLLFFITGISLFRIYYISLGIIDLSPDEAHYWEWSRRPDLSYYSKGPMIAYLIAFGTAIFGDNVFGIRIMAVIFAVLSSIMMYILGKNLFGERTGLASAVLLQMVPLFSVYGVIFTIDSPFIFFWILSLFLFWKAAGQRSGIRDSGLAKEFKTNPQPPSPYYWLLLGLSIGLGLLTKYTMAFFYVCAFFFMLASKEHRSLLSSKWPYISFMMSIAVFSPVIIWNAVHGWVILKHTAGQAHIKEGFTVSLLSFAEFTGSQFGIITPVIIVMLVYFLFKMRKDGDAGKFMFWFSMPVLGFFLLKSIQAKVQANWALPGYVTGVIAFSSVFVAWEKTGRKVKAFAIAGIVIAVIATAISHSLPALPLPPKRDPSLRINGWKELGSKVSIISEGLSKEGKFFIFSDRYQVSSELAFYVKGKPVTYCVNFGRRMNQYDLWPGFGSLINFNAIFVTIGDAQMPAEFIAGFDRCEKEIYSAVKKGRRLREYSIFTCYGFKGITQKGISEY